jgi:signal transduction histidine kinase
LNFNLSINESIKYVKLDKVQFSQVINNLINNAIKFSNKKTPVISISADLFKNNIFISIEDN